MQISCDPRSSRVCYLGLLEIIEIYSVYHVSHSGHCLVIDLECKDLAYAASNLESSRPLADVLVIADDTLIMQNMFGGQLAIIDATEHVSYSILKFI